MVVNATIHFHGQASPVGVWFFLRLPLKKEKEKKRTLLPSFLALIQPSTSHFIFKFLAASRDFKFHRAVVSCRSSEPLGSGVLPYSTLGLNSPSVCTGGRTLRARRPRLPLPGALDLPSRTSVVLSRPRRNTTAPPICVLVAHAICVRGSCFCGLTHPAPANRCGSPALPCRPAGHAPMY